MRKKAVIQALRILLLAVLAMILLTAKACWPPGCSPDGQRKLIWWWRA